MSERYKVTHDPTLRIVEDTVSDRYMAVCPFGSEEENRRDAKRIARLLNAEAAGVDLTTYLAYEAGREDAAADAGAEVRRGLAGMDKHRMQTVQRGEAHVISKARSLDDDTFEVSHYFVGPQRDTAEQAQDDLERWRNAPGWRPVTESEPPVGHTHFVAWKPNPHALDQENWMALKRRASGWYDGPERMPYPPDFYLVAPPLPSEEPDKSRAYLEFEERLAQTGEGEMSFEEARAELVRIACDPTADFGPATTSPAAWRRWADEVSEALGLAPPDGIAAEMEADQERPERTSR